jgi:hypothetical protein
MTFNRRFLLITVLLALVALTGFAIAVEIFGR